MSPISTNSHPTAEERQCHMGLSSSALFRQNAPGPSRRRKEQPKDFVYHAPVDQVARRTILVSKPCDASDDLENPTFLTIRRTA